MVDIFSPFFEQHRRRFLTTIGSGLGYAAVHQLLNQTANAGAKEPVKVSGSLGKTHHAPKAKAVIYLFMAGGPSHLDTFDPKPKLKEQHGKDMPASVLGEQRVTLMTRGGHRKAASTPFKIEKKGKSGIEMTDIMTNIGKVADDLCLIRSIHSEPINHDPAVTFMQTGRPQPGLPVMGSWFSYGLGSENKDLPAYTVMISGPFDQPIPSRYVHSGFLPSQHQGVQFLSGNDPVLYLSNPQGISKETRGDLVDGVNELNKLRKETVKDPEIDARIKSFELAFKMQSSVPELMDISKEDKKTLELYGPEVNTAGSFSRHCLLARRLVERGTRFVQLFHRGWDAHGDVTGKMKGQVAATDPGCYGLIQDLKNRGLLEDTLIICGGEFGRTAYGQGDLNGGFGRDHHPRCFSYWLAGGGVKGGTVIGKTDDFGYNIAERPVHVNDLHATILHLMGIDHTKLTYRHGGRDFRLTDVAGEIVKEALA